MRAKHNKKRNTAFLYEVLTRELTKSLIITTTSDRCMLKILLKSFLTIISH